MDDDYPMGLAIGGKMTAAEKKEAEKREIEYRAKCDMETLIKAEKIKKDPERLAAVVKRKKELMAAMKSIGAEG